MHCQQPSVVQPREAMCLACPDFWVRTHLQGCAILPLGQLAKQHGLREMTTVWPLSSVVLVTLVFIFGRGERAVVRPAGFEAVFYIMAGDGSGRCCRSRRGNMVERVRGCRHLVIRHLHRLGVPQLKLLRAFYGAFYHGEEAE